MAKLKVTTRIGEREHIVEYEGTLTVKTRMDIIETVLGAKNQKLTDKEIFEAYERVRRNIA